MPCNLQSVHTHTKRACRFTRDTSSKGHGSQRYRYGVVRRDSAGMVSSNEGQRRALRFSHELFLVTP